MGIRKHLEEHSEETKLSDLSLETKEQESGPFDVRELVTEKMWQKMLIILEKQRALASWTRFMHLAANLKLIFPERVDRLNLNIFSMEICKEVVNDDLDHGRWGILFSKLRDFKTLFPDHYHELNMPENTPARIKQALDTLYTEGEQKDLLAFANHLNMFRIDFDKFQTDCPSDEIFESLGQRITKAREEKNWRNFIFQVSLVKMLLPERFEEIKITPKEWAEIKKYLENLLKKEPRGSQGAVNLTAEIRGIRIIAAQDVKITDQGIEISEELMTQPDFKQQKNPRPERRQF